MPTILYAEDDRDCRELFAFILRQHNYRVYEAVNGAQAVQIVRDEPIDLVILDVRMPMMTGYDAARMIGREAPHIPVIFLSAKGLQREVQKAFEASWEELLQAAGTIYKEVPHVNRCMWWLGPSAPSRFRPLEASVTRARLDLLREADALVMDGLRRQGFYGASWQCPTVLVPLEIDGVGR